MTDDKIYCPNCKERTEFMRVPKYVRDFELGSNDKVKANVIQRKICEYPIGVYPDPVFPDTKEE